MSDTFDLQSFLKTLTHRPGVYRMLDEKRKVIYVGKARDLKKRVSTYFQKSVNEAKTAAMIAQVAAVEVTLTNTEADALLLEHTLIKQDRPRYNVVLRDDKSDPFIYASTDRKFPRLSFHRGARKGKGKYFGPYPSAGAVRQTLAELQKLFMIRNCSDTFFRNRSRPCLQYHIQRCTAPCVGYVAPEEYARDVQHAVRFLEGRSCQLIDELGEKMESASKRLAFEEAAACRDQIARLKTVQQRFAAAGRDRGDIDVLAVAEQAGVYLSLIHI